MKKQYVIAACVLLTTVLANSDRTFASEENMHRSQEQTRLEYQAQVDPSESPALLQVMQQNRFEHKNMITVQSMIRDAQQKGLPVEPLESKVFEGLAKNVEQGKIVKAVSRVHNRYERSYQQAGTLSRNRNQVRAVGDTLAEAYAAGLGERDCDQIMEQLRERMQAMDREQAHELAVESIRTVRDMARMGVQSSVASDVVVTALQHSYQAQDMEQLQNTFRVQARLGTPNGVAKGFADDIGHGAGAGGLGSGSGGSAGGAGSSAGTSGSSGSGSSGSDSSSGSGSSGSDSSSGSGSSGSDSSSESSGGSSGGSDGSSGSSGGSSGGSGGSSGGSGGSSGGSGGSSGGSGR